MGAGGPVPRICASSAPSFSLSKPHGQTSPQPGLALHELWPHPPGSWLLRNHGCWLGPGPQGLCTWTSAGFLPPSAPLPHVPQGLPAPPSWCLAGHLHVGCTHMRAREAPTVAVCSPHHHVEPACLWRVVPRMGSIFRLEPWVVAPSTQASVLLSVQPARCPPSSFAC